MRILNTLLGANEQKRAGSFQEEQGRPEGPYLTFFLAAAFLSASLMLALFPHSRVAGPGFSGQYMESPVSPAPVSAVPPDRFSAYGGLSKGKFLVAGPNITDPRFSETVILLVDYEPNGAMGLVINRPSRARLSSVFPEIEGLKKRADTIFSGGPVRMDQMFLLVRSSGKPEDSYHVFKDVYASGSKKLLQRMIDQVGAAKKFRVFAGYAGWGAGQLEREVARGDWYVLQADAESIFEKESSEVWRELFRRGSVKWVRAGVCLQTI